MIAVVVLPKHAAGSSHDTWSNYRVDVTRVSSKLVKGVCFVDCLRAARLGRYSVSARPLICCKSSTASGSSTLSYLGILTHRLRFSIVLCCNFPSPCARNHTRLILSHFFTDTMLLNQWQIAFERSASLRISRDLRALVQLIYLLKHILSVFHHYVLLTLHLAIWSLLFRGALDQRWLLKLRGRLSLVIQVSFVDVCLVVYLWWTVSKLRAVTSLAEGVGVWEADWGILSACVGASVRNVCKSVVSPIQRVLRALADWLDWPSYNSLSGIWLAFSLLSIYYRRVSRLNQHLLVNLLGVVCLEKVHLGMRALIY